jgi:hypothetical protein
MTSDGAVVALARHGNVATFWQAGGRGDELADRRRRALLRRKRADHAVQLAFVRALQASRIGVDVRALPPVRRRHTLNDLNDLPSGRRPPPLRDGGWSVAVDAVQTNTADAQGAPLTRKE